jgi:hypothetical protein
LFAPKEDKVAGWDRRAIETRDVLEHIAALLFALATLADLAAGAPSLRRRRVLEILSFGEAEARAFVFGIPADAMIPADAPESSADAAGLAASFRALALALCALLARAALFAFPGAAGARFGRPSQKISGPAGRRAAPPAPDTS